tara:strand:- start:19348 stop:19641 length:294 start_codon:yes stop_codon:yes gene_type:complete
MGRKACQTSPFFPLVFANFKLKASSNMEPLPTKKKITSTGVLPNGMKSTLSWDPNIDPETEDRIAFLKLSYSRRWNDLKALIESHNLATNPPTIKNA